MHFDEGIEVLLCSFYASGQDGIHIPATVLLRALQRTGLLRQWDRKRQRLRKITL